MGIAEAEPLSNVFLRYLQASTQFTIRVLRGLLWPKIDVLIRVGLVRVFFVSGVMQLTHWAGTLADWSRGSQLAFMTPMTMAYTAVAIEVVGSAFLTIGFMTRYAALGLLILCLASQFAHKPFDVPLFWVALFCWYAVQGAGPISMDALLRQGLADSALPAVPRILIGTQWIRVHLAPLYLSIVRVWLAVAMLAGTSHMTALTSILPNIATWLPLDLAARIPREFGWVGVFLLLGIGTRYIGTALIIGLMADAMMDPRKTDAVYLLMLLSILAIQGGGWLSADRVLAWFVSRQWPALMRNPQTLEGLPRVVVVGAGFAGVSCAAALRNAAVSVTLIDRENYHLFQPLLYQVATAALSPGDIATPVRQLFRDAFRIRVILGAVTGVDTRSKIVLTESNQFPYDYLVLATGATHIYFGKNSWASYAPGLKGIGDALEIRRRILTAFERAEAATDAQERAALLTFLVVGGGPTGVELAGSIAELARFGMAKEFRTFDPAEAQVLLVQSAPRLLPAFAPSLASVARRSLERLGVEVLLGSRVEAIDGEGVLVGSRRIAAKTVLWAAGVAASPAAKWLMVDADNAGRIRVADDLTVSGFPDVFAVGDTAAINGWNGQPVPGLAPAAKQSGKYVGQLIKARVNGRAAPPPFKYRHLGSLATIGRKAAVADLGGVKLWGAPAWWLWGLIHVGFLVGLRNRVATMTNWMWAYLTYGGGIRLITGTDTLQNQSRDPAIPANADVAGRSR